MSSVLNRKKKRMQPLGYYQEEIESIQRQARRNTLMKNTVQKAYLDVKLVGFLILHDKFGWGLKRIGRLESGINQCLEKNAERGFGGSHYEQYLKEKCKINVTDETNMIPHRERVLLVYDKFPTNAKLASDAGKIVAAAIYNYFAVACTVLKEEFKFSANQLREFMYWIRYYVNSIALWSQSGGKRGIDIPAIAEVLMDECKYCDSRFIGGSA